MNKAEKQVVAESLRNEATVIRQMRENYKEARANIEEKIKELAERDQTQSVIWQRQYQESLKQQLDSAIDILSRKNYTNIHQYLLDEYDNGFIGTMYNLQQQGIPMVMPIDQRQVAKMVETTGDNIKLSKKLYGQTTKLKNAVRREVSIGLSSGESYQNIAGRLTRTMNIDYNKSVRIARTEGHRVNQASGLDAALKAKDNGADIVKQWDATLDGRTRAEHRQRDGEVRELDEMFSGNGIAPGMYGRPWEDINCRCVMLKRARWAVEGEGFGDYTKYSRFKDMSEAEYQKWKSGAEIAGELKHGGVLVNLSDSKNFAQFAQRYKAVADSVAVGVSVTGGAASAEAASSVIEFVPASTIKEANTFATDVLGIPKADYKGLDVKIANEMNQAITEHFKRFPELKDNFGFIGSSQNANRLRKELWEQYYYDAHYDTWDKFGFTDVEKRKRAKKLASKTIGRNEGNVWAWSYSPEEIHADYSMRGITFNEKWGKKDLDKLEKALKRNVESKYHPESCDTVKSIVDHEIGHQLDTLLDISNDVEFRGYYNGMIESNNLNNIKDGLSGYAEKNEQEFIAEAWAEYMNNPEPRWVAQFVGELIEKKYKAKFGG